MGEERWDFFVSYTGRDEDWATWISRILEEEGYRVVVQAWDFGPGIFPAAMERAVQGSRRLLPVLSEAYLKSKWGRQEFAAFADTPEAIIPVQIQDLETRSLLRAYNRVNLRGLEEPDAAQVLRTTIARLVGAPGLPAPPRGRAAPFPGAVPRVAPADEEGAPAGPHPARITVDRGRLQLVMLGTGPDDVIDVPALLDVPEDRVLALHGSAEPAAEQLAEVAAVIDGLDADAVTDVVVVFSGSAAPVPGWGTRLHVPATDVREPRSWLRLEDLLSELAARTRDRRVYVLLDTPDGEGGSTVPATVLDGAPAVPVLDLWRAADAARPAEGLTGLVRAVHGPPAELNRVLEHWAPLAFGDLALLSGGTLHTPPNWAGGDIGLAANPLAWPAAPAAVPPEVPWAVVLADADSVRNANAVANAVSQVQAWSRGKLDKAFLTAGRDVRLAATATRVNAGEVLASPASFARAVEHVCRSEVAVFDLTDYEPAVMVLLGIRAVIRRGVTLCVHNEHAERWRSSEPPFHLREISMLAEIDYKLMTDRLVAGIRQLGVPGRAYCDLPGFELLRSVPAEQGRRGNRAFDVEQDPSILALVPFDAGYTAHHWEHLRANLPEGARMAAPERLRDTIVIRLERTLDLNSPRVVSAQLYEAIRLTDFCLVDLTSMRPNVVFELGVRLAANRLHPVVVHDPTGEAPNAQGGQLVRLLAAIQYSPQDPDFLHISRMVDRHVELRHLEGQPTHPRQRTVLDGFPPRGVHDLAWGFAEPRDEVVTIPVPERLEAAADALLVNPSKGSGELVYPEDHGLSSAAEHSGREHLLAAWLYQHFRERGLRHPEPAARARHAGTTAKLVALLVDTGDPADARFAAQIRAWSTATGDTEGALP